jgi:hypothetical protein
MRGHGFVAHTDGVCVEHSPNIWDNLGDERGFSIP